MPRTSDIVKLSKDLNLTTIFRTGPGGENYEPQLTEIFQCKIFQMRRLLNY